jgi:hypothetical protein
MRLGLGLAISTDTQWPARQLRDSSAGRCHTLGARSPFATSIALAAYTLRTVNMADYLH